MKMKHYNRYPNFFKQNLLEEYHRGVFGSGFKSLVKRFKIKGGHKLIMHWYRQCNGTVQSLNSRSKGGRPRTLTKNEVKLYVLDFVRMMNNKFKTVNYRMIQSNIESSLDKKVPLSTIKRYGKQECGLRSKKTHELTLRDSKYNNRLT